MSKIRSKNDIRLRDTLTFRRLVTSIKDIFVSPQYAWITQYAVLAGEAVLCILIIRSIRFTNIDWIAYMQQIDLHTQGERDYVKIRGDTGPVVYPAGFIYVYSLLHWLTHHGKDIRTAQYIFAFLYVATMTVVFRLYRYSRQIPPYAYALLSLSKRLHSLYMLRLFNDCIAMFVLYIAIWCLCARKWTAGSLLFSAAVSVKMNILLFAPALGFVLAAAQGLKAAVINGIGMLAFQILLGLPFLLAEPKSYLTKAFEFSRKFLYEWTVNWRFLPLVIFESSRFSILLLVMHAVLLIVAINKWSIRFGGLQSFIAKLLRQPDRPVALSPRLITPSFIIATFGCSNLIGMLCARSLHYQFYVWEAHQLVFLAWSAHIPTPVRLAILAGIELGWETFPSTAVSSLALLLSHVALVWASLTRINWQTI